MRLRHFHANRPAAKDQQMPRRAAQPEQGFIGQKRHLCQPGNCRHHRARSGGDHEPPRADARFARHHLARGNKARGGADHLAAQALEPFLRIVGGDGGDGGGDVILDRGKIDLRFHRGNAKAPGLAQRLRPGGGGDQRL